MDCFRIISLVVAGAGVCAGLRLVETAGDGGTMWAQSVEQPIGNKFSIFLPADHDQLGYVKALARSLAMFLKADDVEELIIASRKPENGPELKAQFSFLSNVISVCDADLIGHDFNIKFSDNHHNSVTLEQQVESPKAEFFRSTQKYQSKGWFQQQALKLAVAKYIHSPFYLILDTDIIAVAPISFHTLFNKKGEIYSLGSVCYKDKDPSKYEQFADQYGEGMKILNVASDEFKSGRCGVRVTPQVLATHVVRGLLGELESSQGYNFWKNLIINGRFTEYSLYNIYMIKHWNDFGRLYDMVHEKSTPSLWEGDWCTAQECISESYDYKMAQARKLLDSQDWSNALFFVCSDELKIKPSDCLHLGMNYSVHKDEYESMNQLSHLQ